MVADNSIFACVAIQPFNHLAISLHNHRKIKHSSSGPQPPFPVERRLALPLCGCIRRLSHPPHGIHAESSEEGNQQDCARGGSVDTVVQGQGSCPGPQETAIRRIADCRAGEESGECSAEFVSRSIGSEGHLHHPRSRNPRSSRRALGSLRCDRPYSYAREERVAQCIGCGGNCDASLSTVNC